MRQYKWQPMLTGALLIGLTAGLMLVGLKPRLHKQSVSLPPETLSSQKQEEGIPPNITIHQEFSYAGLTREEMIDQANVIFLGKVVDISPTRWNQDSGEPWYNEVAGSGMQLHHIEFEVLQPIVDTVGLEKQVTLTVLGSSPVDEQTEQAEGETIYQGGPDHNLKLGDEAVIFARQTDLAWRGGTRPVLALMGNPADAHFIRGADGLYHGRHSEKPVSLAELISRIAQRRETLVQP